MFSETNKKKLYKIVLILLWIGAVLVSIKSIFTDTGFDNSYTIAMSFRHLNGDSMFSQMWEPHQTSIFFTDILMWIYHLFVPSYTGVVLYLQICGTLFFGVLCIPIYKLIKEITNSYIAQLTCIFFLIFRAKQTPFPDFANLQIGFSVLTFLFLVKFFRESSKYLYLVLAGICLCFEILSYPSTIIAYFFVVAAICIFTKSRLKNIIIFTSTCVVFGIVYALPILLRLGVSGFIANIKNIYMADSHSNDYISPFNYFSGFVYGVLWIAGSLLLTFLITVVFKKLKRKIEVLPVMGGIMTVSELLLLFLQKKTGIDWTCIFYIIPTMLMVIGCFGYKKLNQTEHMVWLTGMLLSLASFFATMLLTDLGLITIVAYLVLGGIVSFIPISHLKNEARIFLGFIVLLVLFHRGLVVWGYANRDQVWLVTDIQTMVLSGAEAGVVIDYTSRFMLNSDAVDFDKYINEEDNFLLVGGGIMNSTEFLIPKGKIANYSTIDTPVYNETLLEYYRINPDKTPDVVAVLSYYGNIQYSGDSFIMQWVTDNYTVVGESDYWRFYRRNE